MVRPGIRVSTPGPCFRTHFLYSVETKPGLKPELLWFIRTGLIQSTFCLSLVLNIYTIIIH